MTEKLSRGAIVTKRVLHRVLAVLLLVPPLVWFGARNRLLPEALTTGVGGMICWGLAWVCLLSSAWLLATAFTKDDEPEESADGASDTPVSRS